MTEGHALGWTRSSWIALNDTTGTHHSREVAQYACERHFSYPQNDLKVVWSRNLKHPSVFTKDPYGSDELGACPRIDTEQLDCSYRHHRHSSFT